MFLDTLVGEDDPCVTFQTFNDSQNCGALPPEVLHGRLSEHDETLRGINGAGGGVFLMVNQGDLRGRSAKNVIAVRAVFVDLDGPPLSVIHDSPMKPHIIVESSPGRYHAYWRVNCPLECFKAVQQGLAHRFSGDPSVCDLSRVMRMPGFYHQKGQRFLTRILDLWLTQPYGFDEFILQMSLGYNGRRTEIQNYRNTEATEVTEVTEITEITEVTEEQKSCLLYSVDPSTIPTKVGERNQKLFELARTYFTANPTATYEERRQMVVHWWNIAHPAIGTKDVGVSIQDFERAWKQIQSGKGMILEEVMSHLVKPPASIGVLEYCELTLKLCSVMYSLHLHQKENHGGDPIIMGCRKAGDLLGVDYVDANKLLNTLASDGVIKCIQKGSGSRASRWLWDWD